MSGGLASTLLNEELALTQLDSRPRGAIGCLADCTTATHDLRFWRAETRAHWRADFLAACRLAILPVIAAGVFFSAQGFVARVEYFDTVATRQRPAPIAVAIKSFVNNTQTLVNTSLGMPPAATPLPEPEPEPATAPVQSTYKAEMQMSAHTLVDRWNPIIETASKRFGIPVAWIRAVMRTESGGRTMSSPTRPITSHAGAMGLMQVMPATYRQMRARYGLGANAYDPHDNVFAAAAYLRWLHGRYGFPAMFAVYNDGPAHFSDRVAHGETLPEETRNYIDRITASLGSDTGLPDAADGRRVTLTRPDGEPVSVSADEIASVRAALPGEYAPGIRSVITLGRTRQAVEQSVDEIAATLHGRRHGAARLARRSRLHGAHYASLSHARRVSVAYSMRG